MKRATCIIAIVLTACAGDRPISAAQPDPEPEAERASPTSDDTTTDDTKPDAASSPENEPPPIGCWEREFGAPPAAEGLGPSLHAPVEDCPSCATLEVGPNARGLHPEVLRRLAALVDALPEPDVDEPVAWVNSGKREGPPGKSMHNQGLAVDVVVCGQTTEATAGALRQAGFTCVIEYYDADGNPCHMAHGDMRGTQWAKGAYAKGGWKAKTCPGRALSKGSDCDNRTKQDWSYGKSR